VTDGGHLAFSRSIRPCPADGFIHLLRNIFKLRYALNGMACFDFVAADCNSINLSNEENVNEILHNYIGLQGQPGRN